MSSSDLVLVELTDLQDELVDWLMGTPMIEHWAETVTHTQGYEIKYDKPKHQDKRWAIPPSENFVNDIADEIERYRQMRMDAGDYKSNQEYHGETQSVKNLKEKMREAIQ